MYDHINEATYEKLEVAQNTMARSILGARRFCSIAAMRNELGWKSMRARIYAAKLKYWGKIYFLEKSRWARLSYQSSIVEGWKSKWHEEIMIIRRKLGLHAMVGIRNLEKWNSVVEDACKKWTEGNSIKQK